MENLSVSPLSISRKPTSAVDLTVACVVIAIYMIAVVVFLPAREYLRALGGGLAVFGVIAGAMRLIGRGSIHGLAVFAVAFASSAVLSLPTYPAMGGRTRAAIPIGFLGVLASVLLFASMRWVPRPPKRSRVSLGAAMTRALLMGTALSFVAAIPIGLSFFSGNGAGPLVWVFPAYFVGFGGAAVSYWALQRIDHLATGRYLLGAIGGFCFYGAITPVVSLIEREPFNVGMMVFFAAIAGGLVGPAVALGMTDDGTVT